MTAGIGEGQPKAPCAQCFTQRAELSAIDEQIVQCQHRRRQPFPARFIAQAVSIPRCEARHSRPTGCLWVRKAHYIEVHEVIGSPASDEDLGALPGAVRRAIRSLTSSQNVPATSPPQTEVAIRTGKR